MLNKFAAAVVLGLTSTAANATAVVYTFSGDVVSSSVTGTGSTFSGSFSYDPTVASSSCGSFQYGGSYCTYAAISSVGFSSGSVNSTVTVAPGGNIFQVTNNYKSSLSASARDSLSIDTVSYGSSTHGYYRIMIDLYDTTANTLSNSTAPSPILLSKYNVASFRVETVDGPFGGTITSLTSPSITTDTGGVPEPATWTMMLAGFGLIGRAMRRPRRALLRI